MKERTHTVKTCIYGQARGPALDDTAKNGACLQRAKHALQEPMSTSLVEAAEKLLYKHLS